MNILFMSLGRYTSIKNIDIYTDLLREYIKKGHEVYLIAPCDEKKDEQVVSEEHCRLLRVYTGRIQKTNIIEKGINTVLLENRFISAIKKYLSDVKFDLVLFPTPPITLAGAVEFVKRRDGAKAYLMLKDIFPQNAVDIGMMSKSGIKGLIYKYFRNKEKKLYRLSDYIGCMSPKNVEYLLTHNPEINKDIVEICPNSVDVLDKRISKEESDRIRTKYNIPLDKKVFVYGGNLGKPQGVPFLIKALKKCQDIKDAYFLVVGDGVDYELLHSFIENDKPSNVKLLKRLPKEEYDTMIGSCDIGIICLDYRFTIPNFPSRVLSYLQAGIPIFCATDLNCDMGEIAEKNGFGWFVPSNDESVFRDRAESILECDLKEMGNKGFKFLKDNYSVEEGYNIINKHF